MRHLLPQEWLRFGWYFLITRRDCASGSGCARWVAKNASADHERREPRTSTVTHATQAHTPVAGRGAKLGLAPHRLCS